MTSLLLLLSVAGLRASVVVVSISRSRCASRADANCAGTRLRALLNAVSLVALVDVLGRSRSRSFWLGAFLLVTVTVLKRRGRILSGRDSFGVSKKTKKKIKVVEGAGRGRGVRERWLMKGAGDGERICSKLVHQGVICIMWTLCIPPGAIGHTGGVDDGERAYSKNISSGVVFATS